VRAAGVGGAPSRTQARTFENETAVTISEGWQPGSISLTAEQRFTRGGVDRFVNHGNACRRR